jgi:hypothetical protein
MVERPTSAAGQIWPHLPHDDARVAKQSKRSVADSMWPSLSGEAKAQQAKNEQWQVEQRVEAKRMADHLQATIDAIRAEKRGR